VRHAQEIRAPQPGAAAPEEERGQAEPRPASHAAEAPRVAEAVADVRRLFQAAHQPPRWPMYVRQVKQYLRGVDPTFDERKFGFQSLNDLLRACQRDGLFRMERDRQGVVRFFPGNVMRPAEAEAAGGIDAADIAAAEKLAQTAEAELAAAEAREPEVVDGDVVREVDTPSVVDAEQAPSGTGPSEEPASRSRRRRPSRAATSKSQKQPKEKKPARSRGRRKVSIVSV